MKTFLTSITLLITFLGCSHNNAFDRFAISTERERSEESIHSSKLAFKDEVGGVVSAVYLNKVFPELYEDAEYFYVYLNLEEPKELEFFLNNTPSILVEKLTHQNEFTALTHFDAEWKNYYLVGFLKSGESLNLDVKSGVFCSTLVFKK